MRIRKDTGNHGSQAGIDIQLPDDLDNELRRLQEEFSVDRRKLKIITDRFVEELEEGLKEDGQNIPMNLTWVMGLPHGNENGTFLTLDLGGTNLRVCKVVLSGKRSRPSLVQSQYRLPEDLKTGDAEQLWEYAVDSLEEFIKDNDWDGDRASDLIPLGFTFSYPASQEAIDHGILQTWTKGLDIKGVEGHDVGKQLGYAMEKRGLPVRLVAIVNDTVGALIASAYMDPKTIIGAVFGTGCNAAYMESCASIPKAKHLPQDMQMAINCEYGAFDNSHLVLPRTKYDEIIDGESPRPGEQTFEKCSAGLYLGEIFRVILVELCDKGILVKDQDVSQLKKSYVIDSGMLAGIENDESHGLSWTRNLFKESFGVAMTQPESLFCHILAETIAIRGARLCACGIAAICTKKGLREGHVAADGSVANKHPRFKKRWAQAMAEILAWPEDRESDPIRLTSAEDGSGIGAAVVAAMSLQTGDNGMTT